MKKRLIIFFGLFLIIGLSLFITFKIVSAQDQEEINIESQCFSNLQPENYFTKKPIANIGLSNGSFDIQMIGNNRKIFSSQTAGTGSMRPIMGKANILIFIIPEKDEISIGDIITFKRQTDNKKIVHRVVGKTSEGNFRTKGDNNPSIDDYIVKFEDITGRVVGVLW